MGPLFHILIVPVLCLALVIWAVASRRLSNKLRRASLVIVVLLTCAAFTLIRTSGATSKLAQDFHWRWSKTPEERLLAQAADEQPALASAPAAPSSTSSGATTGADWPGFRGANRDGIVRGVRIATDWSASPPVEMWLRFVDLCDRLGERCDVHVTYTLLNRPFVPWFVGEIRQPAEESIGVALKRDTRPTRYREVVLTSSHRIKSDGHETN